MLSNDWIGCIFDISQYHENCCLSSKGFVKMEVDPSEIEKVLKILTATPHRIKSSTKGLNKIRLHFNSDEEPWSVNDILAHLRASADVWGKSIAAMIVQDHPTLRYMSPRTWIRKKDYPQQEFQISVAAFTKQRGELLKLLKSLSTKDWSRGATFTATAKGREQTVLSYAQRMARHEDEHCIQIQELLQETRNNN